MERDEVVELFGQKNLDFSMDYSKRMVTKSLEDYGTKYSDIITKQERRGTYIITIGYGISAENPKISVFRYRIVCISTMEELALDGSVYDTTWSEKVSFQDIVDKVIGSMRYHIKNLSL